MSYQANNGKIQPSNHSLSTYAKLYLPTQKLAILCPLTRKRTCAYQGVRIARFTKHFVYVLSESPARSFIDYSLLVLFLVPLRIRGIQIGSFLGKHCVHTKWITRIIHYRCNSSLIALCHKTTTFNFECDLLRLEKECRSYFPISTTTLI